jgi:hypothetical protein
MSVAFEARAPLDGIPSWQTNSMPTPSFLIVLGLEFVASQTEMIKAGNRLSKL